MSVEQPNDDPGWPSIWVVMFPWYPRRGITRDPLVALRLLFLAFSLALLLYAFVLTFLDVPNGPVLPWLPILALLAGGSMVATRVFMAKPLNCMSAAKLAESYRTRFFVAIALSEYVALSAFVFTFIGGPKWSYDVGGAFSLLRLWTVAPPTRGGLVRDQERLTASGCELSLIAALRSSPPPP